ncbi:MAG: histidine phosphatase family protein, partial [Synergistaceae bacterium]|nr:histidine phosphatase family protein [Synergistaceae bacterium]
MRILLTRHGLTDWNKDHIFQGSTDRDLSPEGLAQAVKLSMRVMSWGAE